MDKVYEQAFRKQKEDEKRKRKANSSWGSLAPPAGDDAKKSKGPPVREYPAAPFTLRRVAGKSGRNAYENMQKLEVLKFSRQKCSDGNPVGRRGAGKVFGIDKKLIRDWESQEAELIAFSKQKTELSSGRCTLDANPARRRWRRPWWTRSTLCERTELR
ncbi:unnamed protein product [Pylaiella littoralis]